MTSSRLWAWARLVRLPNVMTVWADSTAAFLVMFCGAGGRWTADLNGWIAVAAWLLGVLSVTAMYWGGMILNDLFDVRRDRRSRRSRPLPGRQIKLSSARRAGYGLLLVGFGLASVLALVAEPDAPDRWLPAVLAMALALSIVAYDGPLKRTPLAPVTMGLCRTLSFLLAGSAAMLALSSSSTVAPELGGVETGRPLGPTWIATLPAVVMIMAIGMGVFVTGITTFARREAIGDGTFHLPVGLAAMIGGVGMMAMAPRWGDVSSQWRIDAASVFPLAMLAMAIPLFSRAIRAMRSPSPLAIQGTIGAALRAIIPMMAIITMLAAGAVPAMGVLALLIPSRYLATRIRMS